MQHKWSKTIILQFPYILVVFFLFIALSILYSERNILQIHQHHPDHQLHQHHQDHKHHHHHHHRNGEVLIKSTQPSNITVQLQTGSPRVLDSHSKCSSTVKYSGRRLDWAKNNPEFDDDHSERLNSCDIFSGNWVFDNTSYPLYNESSCPYMSDQLACHKHGRNDLGYQYWRWQPRNCNLKRWNVMEMWEKLRGKRLMFVGDSLNRGQWISMVCLLQSVIPADKRSMTPNAQLTIFKAEEYNATVEFLWAPLLVESNSDDPVNHRLDERIMRPDSVYSHSSQWELADILIFNSYLWWRQGPVKLLWSSEKSGICEELDGVGAMELAMEALADWITTRSNDLRKRLFFVTMSPTHFWKREWEPESEGNCYGEKSPIDTENYWGTGSDLPTMRMVDNILRKLSPKVSVVNITQLSEYRKDGHPSVYRKFWETLSPEQLADPSSFSDCIHWCLPGVPDVWNELLFHLL